MLKNKTPARPGNPASASRQHSITGGRGGSVETVMPGQPIPQIQLRDAKATLSSVVDSAVRGEPSVITRHGRPEAVVVGYDEWQRLSSVPSFGRLLMAGGVEEDDLPERSRKPLRDVDL